MAKVVPIYKQGEISLIKNYRPISILNILSKIFEKLIHRRLYTYLNDNTILNENQFGFRENRSTSQAVLNYFHYVYDRLDNGELVFSIFLDFSKAFDCVSHDVLLHKLSHYGIRGVALDWFKSYLSNRRQYVSIDETVSNSLEIKQGVPQGSVLGPLLFLIYINDFPNISNKFKFTLFADDSTLSCAIPRDNILDARESINANLTYVHDWLCVNKLAINADKTKYIIFSYNNCYILPGIKIGRNRITSQDKIKFLGIYIDRNLKFNHHLNVISNKCSKSIGVLYRISSFLPFEILRQLYDTLILPHLQYGIEIWGHAHGSSKILALQKRAIRIINSLMYRAHTEHYFTDNRILSIAKLYQYGICCYMHKVINGNYVDRQNFHLRTFDDIHSYNTRNTNLFYYPLFRHTNSQNCFCYIGPKYWNGLPENIRTIIAHHSFKRYLKQFILD